MKNNFKCKPQNGIGDVSDRNRMSWEGGHTKFAFDMLCLKG